MKNYLRKLFSLNNLLIILRKIMEDYMELNFFNAEEIQGNAKCTIHKSGKLGFSMDAINMIGIDENKSIGIAAGEDYDDTGNLYIKVFEGDKRGAFSVSKAGEYYYLNTKNLFNKLDIDYKREKVIYDVTEYEINGEQYYKLIRRVKGRK